jgi:hypothetical protein
VNVGITSVDVKVVLPCLKYKQLWRSIVLCGSKTAAEEDGLE